MPATPSAIDWPERGRLQWPLGAMRPRAFP